MWGLMHVWDCPRCGELLDDEVDYQTITDYDNDRTERSVLCYDCGVVVEQRMSVGTNGQPIPVMKEVDDERMRAFAYGDYYDDEY